MQNNQYNIINQLVQEQKSLWRIERNYLNEAGNDEEKMLWQDLLETKKEHVARLHALIK